MQDEHGLHTIILNIYYSNYNIAKSRLYGSNEYIWKIYKQKIALKEIKNLKKTRLHSFQTIVYCIL